MCRYSIPVKNKNLTTTDTEVLYTKVTQQILDRYEKTFEWSLKTKMMGRKPIEGATILVEELQLPMTPEEFHKELYGNLMSMFPDAELMPGQPALALPTSCSSSTAS